MKIKGVSVTNYNNYVKNNLSHKYEEWLNSMSEESRKIYSNMILSSNWYDFNNAYIEPMKVLADIEFEKNYSKTVFDLAYQSALHALNGIYKIFIKIASIEFVMKRVSSIISTYYSDAKIEIAEANKEYIKLTVDGFVNGHELVFDGICGWISGLLSLISKTQHSVTQTYTQMPNNDLNCIIIVKLS